MNDPLVSIIIPTYNRAHLISETLDSVLAQTYSNWECIIVDDESTDNTNEVIKKYQEKDSRFCYYHRPIERMKGPNSCRNYGFEVSKGKYIQWFDSDDILFPETFNTYLKSFSEDVDAVVVKTALKDFENDEILSVNKILSKNLIEDYFIGEITYYVGGPLWRREFLEKQKCLFDENIRNIDDWDFNLRMLYSNPKIVLLDEVFAYYRMHSNSLSKELRKLNKNEIISDITARNKHLKSIKNNNANLSNIKDFLRKRYNRYLKWALFQDHKLKYFCLKITIVESFKMGCYKNIFKNVLGFFLYSIFKRGYFLLKD